MVYAGYAGIRTGECDADGEDGAGFKRQQVEERDTNQRQSHPAKMMNQSQYEMDLKIMCRYVGSQMVGE